MCELAHSEIIRLVGSGAIEIDPFSPDLVGPASVDLRLSNEICRYRTDWGGPIILTDDFDYRLITVQEITPWHQPITVGPGENILALTVERIRTPPTIAARITGRTRYARVPLSVHATADLVNPATNNRQVLEIKNLHESLPIMLFPGMRVCQIIFSVCVGEAVNNGRVTEQNGFDAT